MIGAARQTLDSRCAEGVRRARGTA